MKISIYKQKFRNHECPDIPKILMDVYYEKIYHLICRNGILDNIENLDTIKVRINQAYEGCHSFHFYTSINGLEEFHCEIDKNDKPYMDEFLSNKKPFIRCKWIISLNELIPLGSVAIKAKKRIDGINYIIEEKIKTRKRVSKLKSDYKKYLTLKEEFGKYDKP